jgi:hypothetical protein
MWEVIKTQLIAKNHITFVSIDPQTPYLFGSRNELESKELAEPKYKDELG